MFSTWEWQIMFAKSLAWNTHVLHNPPGSERLKIIFNRFQLSARSIFKAGSINKWSPLHSSIFKYTMLNSINFQMVSISYLFSNPEYWLLKTPYWMVQYSIKLYKASISKGLEVTFLFTYWCHTLIYELKLTDVGGRRRELGFCLGLVVGFQKL
jgi:hypothetical protein